MPQAVGVVPTQSRTEAWNKDLPRKHGLPIMGEKICKTLHIICQGVIFSSFRSKEGLIVAHFVVKHPTETLLVRELLNITPRQVLLP